MANGPKITTLAELLKELNRYLEALGMAPMTIEQIPEGSAGFQFLRGRTESLKRQWERTRPWWDIRGLPGAEEIEPSEAPESITEPLSPEGELPEEPRIGQVIVPGKLVLMPDGTYQDYQSSLPVNTEVAARIIREYGVSGGERWQPGQAEWQAEQAFAREQLEWQRSEAALAQQQSQREQDLTQRLRLEQELGELSGPADWIKRWQMIHGVIPRAEAEMARQQGMLLLNQAQSLAPYGAERVALEQQAYEAFNLANIVSVGEAEQSLVSQGNNLMTQAREATGAERMMLESQAEQLFSRADRLNTQAKVATTPPTPDWLPQFLQQTTGKKGQDTTPKAGEPIKEGRIQTPSGQQWASTPWSVREGLRGFTEFSGFRPMGDILDQMAMMQPRTPTGAGRTQWKPATQRA